MPYTDGAVILPTTAHLCIGTAVTAAKPTLAQITTFVSSGWATTPTGFVDIGHTTLDEIITFGQDGGDSEVRGSLQNKALREVVTEAAIDYLVAKSLQVKDNSILSLYYGGGDATVASEFSLPDNSVPQEKAFLLVIDDPGGPLGLYAAKCSVRREDSIEMPSDEFATVPLRFTLLKASGKPRATWIGSGLGA